MRWWLKLRLALRALLHPGQVDRELDEELQFHLDCAAAAMEPGADSPEAGRALSASGNLDVVREECRDERGIAWIENLLQDSRRALRRLVATPGFSLTAVWALAFGVAAAAAMFSLCDAVLLRPLPGINSGSRLAHLERVEGGTLLGDFSYPDYLDYRAMSRSFSSLAATSPTTLDVALSGAAEPLFGELVTANYFATLGVRAELGRLLLPSDVQPGQNHVVVLSDGLWRVRFGAARGVLGRTLEVNRTPLTIVGVAARGFQGASLTWSSDLWIPITAQPFVAPMGMNCLTGRDCGWVTAFGRLAPGVGLARAQAEVAMVSARIAAAHPLLNARRAEVVAGLGSWSDDRASLARFLGFLLGATLLLVAMTGASLGSLFLARMGARQREVATQLALGASRWRVARQFWLEGGIVAAAGGSLGLLAAAPLAAGLLRLAPSAPANLVVQMDWRVGAFALALAALSAMAMALAPALLTARAGLGLALQQAGRGVSSARHSAQRGMLAAQVSIALLLLIAAGLAARTLQAATAGQVPRAADHTVIALVDAGSAGYASARAAVFFQHLQTAVASVPGITAATLAECIPPAPCNRGPVFLAGTEPPEKVVQAREFLSSLRPDINWVGPAFFSIFDIPLLAGRGFTAADRTGSPLVCVVNSRLAQRLWPRLRSGGALGRRVAWPQYNWTGNHDFTVVGIAADRRSQSLVAAAPEEMYVPIAQVPFARLWIAARGPLPPAATLAVLRRQVAALDPAVPLRAVRTLSDQVRRSVWQPLAIASLAGLFGILAALMAAIGLFGTVAQMVQERRRELGVRLALGATPAALVWMVVRDGLGPLWMGLAAGLGAGAAGTRLLTPWLYGVAPSDPAAWSGAAALLAAVALIAAALAATRAARLHPMDALRCD